MMSSAAALTACSLQQPVLSQKVEHTEADGWRLGHTCVIRLKSEWHSVCVSVGAHSMAGYVNQHQRQALSTT